MQRLDVFHWIERMPRRRNLTSPMQTRRHKLAATPLIGASPTLGRPTLTVGQIAARLGTVAPDLTATCERLRHWTREGLLSPVADHHSGTGNRRKYDPSVVYDAAILNAIAGAGLHIVSRPYLLDALSKARDARQKWEGAESRGPLFLEISHRPRGDGSTETIIHEGEPKCDPSAELSIMINLTLIFIGVRTSRQ
jgi:DNA-binding transcriptional MerR regulator